MAGSRPNMIEVLKMTTDAMINTTLNGSSLTNNTEYQHIETHNVLITALWGIITFIGAVGNMTVVFTMCKDTGKAMSRSATKCYIINVALADLAFIIMVVPITTAAYVSDHWIYGDIMCKLINYMIYVTLLATCLTLTAMTIDRYFAIVHPIKSLQRRTPKSTVIICVVIWIVSLAVCIPFLMFHEVQQMMMFALTTVCLAHWPPGWEKAASLLVVLITYVIPLFIIIVCYTLILKFLWRHRINMHQQLNHNSDITEPVMGDGTTVARRRRKVAKIVAAVVILFAVTWLPIHLFNLCFNFMPDFPMNQTMYNLKIFAHTLSYINSCVNPFVYTIMGDNFRKAFMECICGKSSPSITLHHGYSKRTGSILETRFNGESI